MPEVAEAQQFRRRRFGFFFVFRLAPGFFVGFVPRRRAFGTDLTGGGYWGDDYGYDEEMCIQRINEQEFAFLQRIGVPEMTVML